MNTNLQETGRFLPMCGFTGFTNHIDNSNAVLQEMLNRIKHRGPDAEGTYIDEDIALG